MVIGIDELIPANQRHRWDSARWLWDRRQANTPAGRRWQVDRVEQAAPRSRPSAEAPCPRR
ncbi:hypothetical protein NKG94_44045 [Micromonospora sp. M12]